MTTGKSDNTVTFSFDSPRNAPDLEALQAAIDSGEAGDSTPAPEAKVDETPAQAEEITTSPQATQTEEVQTPAPAKAEPQQVQLKTHKITVDGQELEVTEDDLKSGHMRHRDYTQKTQQIAARERQLDSEKQAWQAEIQKRDLELDRIDQFLRNQNAIEAYVGKAFGAKVPVNMPVLDPNQPPTAAQVAEIARYNAEQIRLQTEQQLNELRRETQTVRQQAVEGQNAVIREKLESQVKAHISTILEKYPILKKFEDIEEELMQDAARRGARNLDEAKVQLSAAADRRFATVKAIADDEKKQTAIKAAELKRNSSQPPGGTAPRPAPAKKLTLDSRDAKALRAAAEEDLRAMMEQ